eukprot:gene6784-3824_t
MVLLKLTTVSESLFKKLMHSGPMNSKRTSLWMVMSMAGTTTSVQGLPPILLLPGPQPIHSLTPEAPSGELVPSGQGMQFSYSAFACGPLPKRSPCVMQLSPPCSPDGASSVSECVGCGPGKSSVGGSPCTDVVVPAIDMTIQRDVRFEFLGPECISFLNGDSGTVVSFNRTITARIDEGSIASFVWAYLFACGSVSLK